MSYILDALRKAEQERQSQQTPDLHSVQGGRVAPKNSSAKWLWIGAVVAVVAAVNVAVWLWPSRAPTGGAGTTVVEAEVSPSKQPQSTARSAAQRSSVAEPEPAVASARAEQRSVQELWQVASPIKAAVQDLKFSFHVYSKKSQRRTIIINDHRMREGDKVTADLTLEEITKDGVILAHPDTLVHVAILDQW